MKLVNPSFVRTSSLQSTVHRSAKTVNRKRSTVYQSGQILIIAVIFLAVVLILISSLFSRVTNYLQFGSNSIMREQAVNVAEAGVDRAVWQINKTTGCSPQPQCIYNGETNTAVGTTGTFTTTITNKTPSLKTIQSKGCIPNCTNPRSSRTIKVDALISSDVISFNYAVQVGNGGVTMDNNSTVNGTIYSNKTGVSISGGNGSKITSEAWAHGTIGDPPSVGTPPSPTKRHENQPTIDMPSVDYQEWRDAATAEGTTTCSPTCTLSGIGTIGPRKYIGNVTLSNNSVYTMQGPVYITGNLTLDNGSEIKLDQSFGSNGTVILVDPGTVYVDNNAKITPTTSNPKGYILVVSTSSANNAVFIDNNGVNAVFYALDGGATLDNNAGTTALVAKSLFLNNNATLTYDQGLASAQFSEGPGGSWQIKKGTYRIQ